MRYHAGMAAWALLREARAQARLSQRALSEHSGVAQSEIARIEGGRQDPSFTRLEQLLRAAGYDLKLELVPHDDHDDRLIRQMLALPVSERLGGLEEQSDFFASVREVPHGGRP
jgi:transcriptional regulator with XRE-family HTH domain